MTNKEVMQMALDAIHQVHPDYHSMVNRVGPKEAFAMLRNAASALRAAITQPETKPVAWYYAGSRVEPESVALDSDLYAEQKANCTPLYTAPPQREWIRLTDEEIDKVSPSDIVKHRVTFARVIEAKLKEKNGY